MSLNLISQAKNRIIIKEQSKNRALLNVFYIVLSVKILKGDKIRGTMPRINLRVCVKLITHTRIVLR